MFAKCVLLVFYLIQLSLAQSDNSSFIPPHGGTLFFDGTCEIPQQLVFCDLVNYTSYVEPGMNFALLDRLAQQAFVNQGPQTFGCYNNWKGLVCAGFFRECFPLANTVYEVLKPCQDMCVQWVICTSTSASSTPSTDCETIEFYANNPGEHENCSFVNYLGGSAANTICRDFNFILATLAMTLLLLVL